MSEMIEPGFVVPDLTEAVEGWRAWGVPARLPRYGRPPKLYSVTYATYFWKPRETAQAECLKCEDVPGERHTCGFYSAKTFAHLQSMTYHRYNADATGRFRVVGQVANWGKVVEGTKGWRSQFSYPARLFVPYEAYELAGPLEKAYGVPVELKNILRKAGTHPPRRS